MVWVMDLGGMLALVYLGIFDWRTWHLPLKGLILFLIAGILRLIFLTESSFLFSCLCSLVIWLICMISNRLTSGIGTGDIWLLVALPFWKPGDGFLYCIAASFAFASVYGIIRYGFRDRKQPMPFVPFLAASFILVSVVTGIREGVLS